MSFRFATAGRTCLPLERARVLRDGVFDTPKISHPEGVAVGPDGWVWCGNQDGDILRISPDGARMERVASTGGFALGLAFDGDRALYVCDMRHAAVFRLDLASRRLERFSAPGIRIPNYPLVDHARRRLLVSDSFASGEPGPGIWAYDLGTGVGALWYDRPMNFANGLAMRPGEEALFVCETFAPAITRIAIRPDGTAGEATAFATDLPGLPDGIAVQGDGAFVVGCYEPSRLLRIPPDGGGAEILIEDPTAHLLCHPTNIAFDGSVLYAANLGRWHITRVEMDASAAPLWEASR
ncbi:MAG: SMP-30/gluconolactonase/LRE family protein [Tropicimonas sp.]|uniref:SMP-30/gluconolactonase/LRE family protein n=1 Tax=Tropicimonas sp. TaxID=2067044 RepID=UPI003A8957B5